MVGSVQVRARGLVRQLHLVVIMVRGSPELVRIMLGVLVKIWVPELVENCIIAGVVARQLRVLRIMLLRPLSARDRADVGWHAAADPRRSARHVASCYYPPASPAARPTRDTDTAPATGGTQSTRGPTRERVCSAKRGRDSGCGRGPSTAPRASSPSGYMRIRTRWLRYK